MKYVTSLSRMRLSKIWGGGERCKDINPEKQAAVVRCHLAVTSPCI
jgi:hypothetical protein